MEHELDFEIFTRGKANVLMVVDLSKYYKRPDNAIIEVKFPSLEEFYGGFFNISTINPFTTQSLGFSTEKIDFPDGLYKIRYSVAPNKEVFICKNYMKLDQINNKMAKLINKECPSKEDIDKLYEIDKLLTGAKYLENENPNKSIMFFQEAEKKINKLNCEEDVH